MNRLLTEPELVVQRHPGFLWQPPSWEFRAPSGESLAEATRQGGGGFLGGSALWVVADEAGPVWWLDQRSAWGHTSFQLGDAQGELLGEVAQENAFLAPQFRLTAADGTAARLDGGRMGAWTWSVEGANGEQLGGEVVRTDTGLIEAMAKERTYLVRRAAQLPLGLWPLTAVACVCWDIVHERKRRSDGGGAV